VQPLNTAHSLRKSRESSKRQFTVVAYLPEASTVAQESHSRDVERRILCRDEEPTTKPMAAVTAPVTTTARHFFEFLKS
jgi:hypothetical protein